MPDYRRNRIPGGTYFFTVNLHDRGSDLLVTNIAALRQAVRDVRRRAPFHIDAWVILPNHMHAIWTLPLGDTDYSGRWRALKKAFTKAVPVTEHLSAIQQGRNERGIWQRRFWEHTIRDDNDYVNHVDYVHFNPVKHSYVEYVADWPFSSFHRAVARGLYPVDWNVATTEATGRGERG
ncbi:MAG: transposase [Acetobacteraceae bacterium]|nr:transposase [Acetobacteraceae bacterium]